jgi:tRNA nucleotidyltransferase (CCA-adding enzyme)
LKSSQLPGALSILDVLANSGFEAYLVGGCVRDHIMQRPIQDIDIATSASPAIVQSLFPKVIPTGLQHGTVTVLTAGSSYEVTTFRQETGYVDFRRPTDVVFVQSLIEDLARRDFTMNAMAIGRDGVLVDPFGGVRDIEARLVRCVGSPVERFGEDALRMLRAVRFAGTLGFRVEPATWAALVEQRGLLRHIAMERVRVELERLTAASDPLCGWQLLQASGLLAQTKRPLAPLAPVQAPPPRWRALAHLPRGASRWALLLHAAGATPAQAQAALAALAFAGDAARAIAQPLRLDAQLRDALGCAGAASTAAGAFKAAALRYGAEAARLWLELTAAASEIEPEAPAVQAVLAAGNVWLEEMQAFTVQELAIDGKSLMRELSLSPGPRIGELLNRLLEDVALHGILNESTVLLQQARQYQSLQ